MKEISLLSSREDEILKELVGDLPQWEDALWPKDVGSVYLTLPQAFPMALPPPGPDFLIPYLGPAGVAGGLCYSSVHPGLSHEASDIMFIAGRSHGLQV